MTRATHRRFLRSASFVVLAAALGQSGYVRRAEAELKLQGVGEARVGYTDNIQSAPDVPLPGNPPKSGGVFALLSPKLVLASVSARVVQRLTYKYTYDLVLGNTDLSTSSNELGYRGFFDLSPSVSLLAGASAIQSNMHSAVVLSPPGAGAVDAVPPGTGSFLAATADELVTWEASRDVRLYESAVILEQTPIFDTVAPRTFGLGGRLGVERPWEGNALGVETRADYTAITGSLNVDGTPAGEQRQIVGTGVGFWRHDWGRYFTSRTEGGALRVQRLNTGHGFWEPTGLAALAYVMEYGDAELTADHTVRTNPLIGQSLIVNEVQLRGALPITQKGEILVGLSSGYQNGQILDETAEVAAHVDAVLVDAGVGWQATKSLLVGLRYQHYEQVSDTRVPPLPLSFVRNSVILGAAFLYPPDSEMPRQYRAPLRVDRTDEIRDTTEPAPEPRTQPGGAGAGT